MASAEGEKEHRVLFIDAYDSFANNIVALIEQTLGVSVHIIRIDDPRFHDVKAFRTFLTCYDAVVAGPGPGTAENGSDVGLIQELWSLPDDCLIPVLGICLGFQSLALAHGGTIERLNQPRHGIITEVIHNGKSIFKGVGGIEATQYHSLHVNVQHVFQTHRAVSSARQIWECSGSCPLLQPLAWDCASIENGPVLMAIRHLDKPFWGVQYHPESICTNTDGADIIRNWWTEVSDWGSRHRKDKRPEGPVPELDPGLSQREQCSKPQEPGLDFIRRVLPRFGASSHVHWSTMVQSMTVSDLCSILEVPDGREAFVLESGTCQTSLREGTGRYSIIACPTPGASLRVDYYSQDKLLELWFGDEREQYHLEEKSIWEWLKAAQKMLFVRSGRHDLPFWGGFIGFISYEAGLDTIDVPFTTSDERSKRPDISFVFTTRSIVVDHAAEVLYLQTIEAADRAWVEEMERKIRNSTSTYRPVIWKPEVPARELPDVHFTVKQYDDNSDLRVWASEKIKQHYLEKAVRSYPPKEKYLSQIKTCQEAIKAGNSYEICLTAQNSVGVPVSSPGNALPWLMYQNLRKSNPAPFGAFVRMKGFHDDPPGLHILSSSPERFLSWDRSGLCQYRPIKGTVKKRSGVTKDEATRILMSSKEKAENLMIVDLIRHDLHGVVGAGNVEVTKLMGVEEYKSVYQLVSVIEGKMPHYQEEQKTLEPSLAPANPGLDSTLTGIDILAASLPPGSMTGAPKRRTCSLLAKIESSSSPIPNITKTGFVLDQIEPSSNAIDDTSSTDDDSPSTPKEYQPRGIYSGLLGYLDVGGRAEFSVVIRTAYTWDDDIVHITPASHGESDRHGFSEPESSTHDPMTFDSRPKPYQIWHVGAGGAITAQSDPEAEYEEMCVKRDSVRGMFKAEKRTLPVPRIDRIGQSTWRGEQEDPDVARPGIMRLMQILETRRNTGAVVEGIEGDDDLDTFHETQVQFDDEGNVLEELTDRETMGAIMELLTNSTPEELDADDFEYELYDPMQPMPASMDGEEDMTDAGSDGDENSEQNEHNLQDLNLFDVDLRPTQTLDLGGREVIDEEMTEAETEDDTEDDDEEV